MSKMIRAVGYVRVSTEDQAREGISVEMQRKKIGAYCQLNDLFLMGFLEDEGISAKSITIRPGLQNLLKMVDRKDCDAVVMYKLDRMFRNTVDALTTAQRFERQGIVLHSITEKLDTKSAMGKFFFSLTASYAEMERCVISERTRDALNHKRQNGEQIGTIPFGQRLDPQTNKLVADESEQSIITRISELRNRKNLSFGKIAKDLNSQNILTRRGTLWTPVTIRNHYLKAEAAGK